MQRLFLMTEIPRLFFGPRRGRRVSHRGWHPPANVGRFRYGTPVPRVCREKEREKETDCFVPIWFPYEYAETAST